MLLAFEPLSEAVEVDVGERACTFARGNEWIVWLLLREANSTDGLLSRFLFEQ